MRRPYLAANWKMNKTVAEADAFFGDFVPQLPGADADVVVCPPFTALGPAVDACEGTAVRIAAQNMHEEPSGAFTGEVSAQMLTELGVSAVVLGHSERRQYFGETDEALSRKVVAALDAGLEPILCVGESEAQRDAGETAAVLTRQIEADLAAVGNERLGSVVIAYEPIWAIGTGKTASTEQAQEACAQIRELLAARSPDAAEAVRILYGGSMKPANAGELIAQADVDGGLVGGASLDPADFAAIVGAAGA
ncbi:MAG: triose-phosphate isomerase [Solirubrobacterales bacterium]